MKKLAVNTFFILLMAVILTACGENVPNPSNVTDVGGYDFRLYIEDEKGVSLVDPDNRENCLSELNFTYQERKYSVNGYQKANTRYLVPYFYGAELSREGEFRDNRWVFDGDWYVSFGKFDSEIDVKMKDLDVFIGDEKKVTLSCSNEFHWEDGLPKSNLYFYVNGNLLTDAEGGKGCFHFLYTSAGELEYLPSEYE